MRLHQENSLDVQHMDEQRLRAQIYHGLGCFLLNPSHQER